MADIQDLSTVDDNNQQTWPENTMVINQLNNAGRADEGLMARWNRDYRGDLPSTGSNSAYAVSSARTVTAYFDGLRVDFRANHANTGDCTLAVSGLTTKPLRDNDGQEIPAGFIQPNQIISARYNASLDEFRDTYRFSSLPADTVGTPQIKDKAVTLPKMADGTQGGILYYGASGVIAELPAGNAGEVLQTNGAGADPAWGTGAKILQVIEATSNTAASTTSQSFVASPLSASITLADAANSVLVMTAHHLGQSGPVAYTTLYRGGTNITDSGGEGNSATIHAQDHANGLQSTSILKLDTPGTVGPHTYAVYYKSSSTSAVFWNRSPNQATRFGQTQIILMEIAA